MSVNTFLALIMIVCGVVVVLKFLSLFNKQNSRKSSTDHAETMTHAEDSMRIAQENNSHQTTALWSHSQSDDHDSYPPSL